jgi:hypothetical protein
MATVEGTLGPYQSAGAPVAGASEVQTITIGGTPTGGTFRLSFQGFVTNAVTWTSVNATLIAAVQGALQGIPSIGGGNATVAAGTLTAGIGTMLVTFGGSLAGQALPTIGVADNAMTGTTPTIAVAETTPGVTPTGFGALKGALLIDTTNGALFQNTGTPALPVWTSR